MTDLDVERALLEEWDTFVASGRPDADLAVTLQEGRSRISRPMILAELEEVLLGMADLRRALAVHGRADLPVTNEWTMKDVVAHLASWATEFRHEIDVVARHAAFDYLITFVPRVGPTAWNAREVERRRGRPLDDLFAEYTTETERLQDLALTLDDDVLYTPAELPQTSDGRAENRWRVPLADLMLMKCWHDRYHLERLHQLM
jgi:hypothetical protein